MKIPKTIEQMREVFNKFLTYVEKKDDPDLVESVAEDFNYWLDEFLENDFFGTEGQNDPRGDHRG